MRILTAGFDRKQTEQLGGTLLAGGHAVLSASGPSSCRTLASTIRPDVVMVPSGARGHQALGWAPDLLAGVPVTHLAPGADPVAALDGTSVAHDGEPSALTSPESTPVMAPPPPVATRAPVALDERGRPTSLRPTRDTPDIKSKLDQVRFGDYHTILEVQPGATTYVIRQHYDTLRQLYTPTGWPVAVGPGEIEQLREVGRGIEDAFCVLGHPPYQARYEAAISSTAAVQR